MLFTSILLAISTSIDSLGIGITYGIRNTKISTIATVILFFISIAITNFSLFIGSKLSTFLPEQITSIIGCILLCCMGAWIFYQSCCSKKLDVHSNSKIEKKVHQFFIKFLGITIQIIRDPISSDLDNSHKIDSKEAIYLGIALSLDSVCIGIGGSILGLGSILFPFLVATFQIIFLTFGRFLGKKILKISTLSPSIWNKISGILLISIGISRFII